MRVTILPAFPLPEVSGAFDHLRAWSRGIRRARRLYRATPPALRRPEAALKAALVIAVVWFAVLFAALGVLTGRVGYLLALLVGISGGALVVRGRIAPAAWGLGAMLVIGQAVTLIALV